MAAFPQHVTLGRSGLQVGPLGVAGGYGVDAASLHRALERGVNYWYHGSLARGGMTQALREATAAGRRDRIVTVFQGYIEWGYWLERTLRRELKKSGLDYADVLLLGWYNKPPSEKIMARVAALRQQGLVRHVAVSSHHRPTFVTMAADPRFDALHIRYNAVHPGAERDVFPHLAPTGRPGVVAYTATCWGKLLSPGAMPAGEAPLRGRDAYRFVLSNPDFQVCMTGPKDAAQMDEALAALDDGPLSPEEMARIRKIGAHIHGK